MPSQGDKAPDFTLPRDGGGEVTLTGLFPKKVVLYFYPKDDTPGCTTEALDFTRLADEFAAAAAQFIFTPPHAWLNPAQILQFQFVQALHRPLLV